MLALEDMIPIAWAALGTWLSYSALEATIRSLWPMPPAVHDSRWQAVLYSCNVAVGVYVAYKERDWFFDAYSYHDRTPISFETQMYMGVGIGTYIHLTFYQYFVAPVMKDRLVMFAHHVLALALLACAIATGLYRWTGPIMLIHDLADPPLHIAKMVNRQAQLATDKVAKAAFQSLADSLFFVFILVFYVTRLYIYPTRVLWVNYELRSAAPFSIEAMNIFCVMLSGLEVMHIYWGFLLAQVIYRKVFLGQLGDNREDEDEVAVQVAQEVKADKSHKD